VVLGSTRGWWRRAKGCQDYGAKAGASDELQQAI